MINKRRRYQSLKCKSDFVLYMSVSTGGNKTHLQSRNIVYIVKHPQTQTTQKQQASSGQKTTWVGSLRGLLLGGIVILTKNRQAFDLYRICCPPFTTHSRKISVESLFCRCKLIIMFVILYGFVSPE